MFIEDFKHKGQPPERARVRFSSVMTKAESGWQVRFYLGRGFRRMAVPFAELFEREPEDVHLRKML